MDYNPGDGVVSQLAQTESIAVHPKHCYKMTRLLVFFNIII